MAVAAKEIERTLPPPFSDHATRARTETETETEWESGGGFLRHGVAAYLYREEEEEEEEDMCGVCAHMSFFG